MNKRGANHTCVHYPSTLSGSIKISIAYIMQLAHWCCCDAEFFDISTHIFHISCFNPIWCHAKMCRVFVNCGMFAGFYSHCGNVSYSQCAIPECKNATTHTFDRFNAILNLILPRNNMNTRVIILQWCVYHTKITRFCGCIFMV